MAALASILNLNFNSSAHFIYYNNRTMLHVPRICTNSMTEIRLHLMMKSGLHCPSFILDEPQPNLICELSPIRLNL